MGYKDFLKAASDYVCEHGRMSTAVVLADKPYMVRWPPTAGMSMRAADTHDLTLMVAKAMAKKAKPAPTE